MISTFFLLEYSWDSHEYGTVTLRNSDRPGADTAACDLSRPKSWSNHWMIWGNILGNLRI